MKRFVVLCSVVALISLCVPGTWATAPSVSDLPDLRLESGSGSGTGLSKTLDNAYQVEDFIKDFDDPVSSLTITLPAGDITMVDPPPSLSPNLDGGEPTIELDVSNNVDAFGRANPGWARYTVNVDDASNPVTSKTAIAKYSTFALNTPSLSEGRFFDLVTNGWQFAYAWMGEDISVTALDSTITPPTAVDWEVYLNDISYDYDANGNLLGINPLHVAHGSSISADGWNVAISLSGGIVLSTSAGFSPGPYLLGVLAINQSDPDDIDATRIMVSAGLLGYAEAGGYPAATHEGSETLDGLTPGPVAAPTVGGDTRTVIQNGSHWASVFVADDAIFDPAQLDIVDLTTDAQLPSAAAADLGSFVAGGNGLKISFDPTTWTKPEAVRLLARVIRDLQAGEVYTFAANIATDIADATHSPLLLMSLSSGLGAGGAGFLIDHIQFGPSDPEYAATQGTILDAYQKDVVPDSSEGWQTLSINYTPPLTDFWFDSNGDNVFDQTDLDFIADLFGNPAGALYEGWTDEKTVARAGLRIAGHDGMTAPFHVWLDNLRIFRSAYELDLGLEKTEFTAPATLTGLLPSFVGQASGSIDGSFESYAGDLGAIGFVLDNGTGLIEDHFRSPIGSFPADATYGDASPGSFSVITGPDHTKSGGSDSCLQIQLTGTQTGTNVNMRAWIDTAIVALPGSGIYAMEAYMTKSGVSNQVGTNRTPKYTFALNQMAPNPLGCAYGYVMTLGGTPNSIADDGWFRIVGTGAIPDTQSIPGKEAVLARGIIQCQGEYGLATSNFNTVKAYVDDMKIYRVDDPAKFFDADLFDSI